MSTGLVAITRTALGAYAKILGTTSLNTGVALQKLQTCFTGAAAHTGRDDHGAHTCQRVVIARNHTHRLGKGGSVQQVRRLGLGPLGVNRHHNLTTNATLIRQKLPSSQLDHFRQYQSSWGTSCQCLVILDGVRNEVVFVT